LRELAAIYVATEAGAGFSRSHFAVLEEAHSAHQQIHVFAAIVDQHLQLLELVEVGDGAVVGPLGRRAL
jgi:hypothetical protein